MKKLTTFAWVVAIIFWMLSLIILVLSLTNLFPDNPFKAYRLIIGIGFISLTGFMRKAYRS
jgi:hypothetical protein